MTETLNDRSREIFGALVRAYLDTGEAVGSKTLSARLGLNLSSATIRNVMADLERQGLLYAPHTSAGRLPTEAGLRFFVHGLLEVGQLTPDEMARIEAQSSASGKSYASVLEEAIAALSGLSRCAGLVLAPKQENPLRHIEFIHLGPGRALVVMVLDSGLVENRIIALPDGVPLSALLEAGNYLNARLSGRTLAEARMLIEAELTGDRASLDVLASRLVQTGLAVWSGDTAPERSLIVRGQAHLLQDVREAGDIERIRRLFEALETKSTFISLLEAAQTAEGVQIFIGSDNALFDVSGCSLIVAPFHDTRARIIGAIGVIGPTRLNYSKVIPMVDYTARVMTRLIGPVSIGG
jgi:heat-inducible transcriptional repressor